MFLRISGRPAILRKVAGLYAHGVVTVRRRVQEEGELAGALREGPDSTPVASSADGSRF